MYHFCPPDDFLCIPTFSCVKFFFCNFMYDANTKGKVTFSVFSTEFASADFTFCRQHIPCCFWGKINLLLGHNVKDYAAFYQLNLQKPYLLYYESTTRVRAWIKWKYYCWSLTLCLCKSNEKATFWCFHMIQEDEKWNASPLSHWLLVTERGVREGQPRKHDEGVRMKKQEIICIRCLPPHMHTHTHTHTYIKQRSNKLFLDRTTCNTSLYQCINAWCKYVKKNQSRIRHDTLSNTRNTHARSDHMIVRCLNFCWAQTLSEKDVCVVPFLMVITSWGKTWPHAHINAHADCRSDTVT